MAYQDFTTFTEVDTSGKLTVNTNVINVSDIRGNSTAYVYKDFGANNIGTYFEYRFKVNCSLASSGFNGPNVFCFAVGQNVGDAAGGMSSNISIMLEVSNTPGWLALYLWPGQTAYIESEPLSRNTDYYVKIIRNGSTVTMWIYNNSSYTNELDVRSGTCDADKTYRYLYAMSSRTDGNTSYTKTLDISNLDHIYVDATVTTSALNVATSVPTPTQTGLSKNVIIAAPLDVAASVEATTYAISKLITVSTLNVTAAQLAPHCWLTEVGFTDASWTKNVSWPNYDDVHIDGSQTAYCYKDVAYTDFYITFTAFGSVDNFTTGTRWVVRPMRALLLEGDGVFYSVSFNHIAGSPDEHWITIDKSSAANDFIFIQDPYNGYYRNFTIQRIGNVLTATCDGTTASVTLPNQNAITRIYSFKGANSDLYPSPTLSVAAYKILYNPVKVDYSVVNPLDVITTLPTSATNVIAPITTLDVTNDVITPNIYVGYIVNVSATVEQPIIQITSLITELDVTGDLESAESNVVCVPPPFDIANDVIPPVITSDCTVAVTPIDINVDLVYPAIHGYQIHAFIQDPLIKITVFATTLDVAAELISPAIIKLYGVSATTDVISPLINVMSLPITQDVSASVIDPSLRISSTYSPDTITATANVVAPLINITNEPTTLNVIVELVAPTSHVQFTSTTLDVSAVVISPTVNVGRVVYPDAVNATVDVLSPTIHLTFFATTLDVNCELESAVSNVINTSTAIDVPVSVLAPFINTTAYKVEVTATVESPLISITNLPDTLDITGALEVAVSNVAITSSTLDVTTTVIDPTIFKDCTVAVATVDVTAALVYPAIHGYQVYAELQEPLIEVTVVPSTLDVALNIEQPTFPETVIYQATTLDVVAAVVAPSVIINQTYIATTLDVIATVITPSVVIGANRTYIATTLDVVAAVVTPSVIIGRTYIATTLDVTATLLAPNVIIRQIAATLDVTAVVLPLSNNQTYFATTLDVATAVLAPSVIIIGNRIYVADTLDVTVVVLPLGVDQTYQATTLDVSTTVSPTIIQVGVSGHVSIQASLLSPTRQVSIQPLTINVVSSLNNPQVKLAYRPGSLTVTGNILPPLPIIRVLPNPLNVGTEVHYDSAYQATTLDVNMGVSFASAPHIKWKAQPLNVTMDLLPPIVFESKTEWYFTMITYGGL